MLFLIDWDTSQKNLGKTLGHCPHLCDLYNRIEKYHSSSKQRKTAATWDENGTDYIENRIEEE